MLTKLNNLWWLLWDKGLYLLFAGFIALALLWKLVCEVYSGPVEAELREDEEDWHYGELE